MGLQPVTYKRTKINFSLSSFHRSFTNTADVLVSVFEFWKLILAVETEDVHRSSLLRNVIQLLTMSQIWERFCTLVCAVIFNVFVFVLSLSIIVRFIPRFYHECCWFNVLPNCVTRNISAWHGCVDLVKIYKNLFNLYIICWIMLK